MYGLELELDAWTGKATVDGTEVSARIVKPPQNGDSGYAVVVDGIHCDISDILCDFSGRVVYELQTEWKLESVPNWALSKKENRESELIAG